MRSIAKFASTPVRDFYTGKLVSHCHLVSEAVAERDAETSTRRLMTGPPGLVVPLRGAVTLLADRYIVGGRTTDYRQDLPIRDSYVLQDARGTGELFTLAQVFAGTRGVEVLAARRLQGQTTTQQGSEVVDKVAVTLAPAEDPRVGQLLKVGGTWLYVKSTTLTDTGFRHCTTDDLGTLAVQASEVRAESLDRVTERPIVTTTTAISVLLPWTTEYSLGSGDEARPKPGDRTMLLPPTTKTPPGCKVMRADGTWLVVGLDPTKTQGAVALRVRPV